MKQLLFMIVVTLVGTVGAVFADPMLGVFVYYLFAVLRPQSMWKWSLPEGINWSLYVALATILAAVLGVRRRPDDDAAPNDFVPRAHSLSWAHYTVFAFAVWVVVTCVMARDFEVAWSWTWEYLKIFLMYAVAAYLIVSVRQVWSLFIMVGLTLAYIAYEVNYLYFVNNYLGIYRNGYGGLDNNGAGLMLAMGVPVCWFAYEGTPGRWYESMTGWVRRWFWLIRWLRYGFLALIPVIVHAVLMTYSRGAMLSLIAVCPVLWWRSRQKIRLTIALTAFVLLAIPMMAGQQIRDRFMTIQDNEVDASANDRRQSWKAAWLMAQDYPIFGVGVRNANLFSYQYGADMVGRTIHSQYFQTLADNGFPGLALYLLMFGGAWFSLRRCRQFVKRRDDPEARTIAACASGLESSLFLYAFGSAFLSLEVFELPYLLLLLSAQLAVVSGAGARSDPGTWSGAAEYPQGAIADGEVSADPPIAIDENVVAM